MATITLELTGGAVRPLRMIGNYDLKVVVGRFAFDSDYLTGGESLAPSDIGLQEINCIVFGACTYTAYASADITAIVPSYDYDNNKVMALGGSTGGLFVDAVSGTDLSNYTSRFIAIGY